MSRADRSPRDRLLIACARPFLGCVLAAAWGCDAKTAEFFAPVDDTAGLSPGGIVGTVTVDGAGIGGVTVDLSPAGSATATDGGGDYGFVPVAAGSYTVGVSGLPADVFCPEASKPAEVAAGTIVRVDFPCVGAGSIVGSVILDGAPVPGVSIALTGPTHGATATDSLGAFAFVRLPSGSYTVTPSGLPLGAVCRPASHPIAVSRGAVERAEFDCTVLGDVEGTVTLDGGPYAGVAVALAGTATRGTTSDAGGAFGFVGVPAGAATVSLPSVPSGVTCTPSVVSITVVAGQSVAVAFECATDSPPPADAIAGDYDIAYTPLGGCDNTGNDPFAEIGTLAASGPGFGFDLPHLPAPVPASYDAVTGVLEGSGPGSPVGDLTATESWSVVFTLGPGGAPMFEGIVEIELRAPGTGSLVCVVRYAVAGIRL